VIAGDDPSTKQALAALGSLAEGKLLIVLDRTEETSWLSLRNVPTIHLVTPDQLNTYDVLISDDVVFTESSLATFLDGAPRGKSIKAVASESEAGAEESQS